MKRSTNRRLLALIMVLLLGAGMIVPGKATDDFREDAFNVEQTGLPVSEIVSEVSQPDINCKAAMLIDMDTGEVIYDYNGDMTCYPASTTKIMTAFLCLKYGNLDSYETIQPGTLSDVSSYASIVGLSTGEEIQVRWLLYSLMLESACDSANVIGQHISGSVGAFVDLMNQEAAALGCTGTHFVNAHGLHNASHYSTAEDLLRITQAAMAYPEFREIVSTAVATMPATNRHGAKILKNGNKLLPDVGGEESYPYATGVKTGYTSQAGYPLVFSADKDRIRLLGVVLGPGSSRERFRSSRNLLEWGYDHYTPSNSVVRASFVLDQESFLYDGTAHMPWITGSLDGVPLYQDQDFTVNYVENTLPGEAKAEITGIGTYTGHVSLIYFIENPLPFEDVSPEHWGYWNLLQGWRTGLIRGVSETEFMPDSPISRGDSAVILYRQFGGASTAADSGFLDITASYQAPAINWAKAEGIFRGVTETEFLPGGALTRQDFAVILHRLHGLPASDHTLDSFRDAEDVSGYAKAAVCWAVEQGLLRGRSSEELCPKDQITRAELVTLLLRYENLTA